MGWRYTLEREAIPLDRQDLPLIKDGTDASLAPTNIVTRVWICDARFDHDALAEGPISTFHSSYHIQIMFVRVHSIRRYQSHLYSTPSLFCRKLLLISHPTPCQLEREDFLEIMQRLEHLLQGHLLLRPAFPCCSLQRSNHLVIVTDDFWLLLSEEGRQKMLHIVLMSDEQIAVRAIATCLVEREHVHRIYMDH